MKFEKRSRREILQLLGVCGLPLLAAAPFAFLRKSEDETPMVFDESLLNKWRRLHPVIALLGNSMIYCRLNTRRIAILWPGLRAMHIAAGGTRSLQWFLWLKNHVAVCRPVPRLVIVFYRDYDFNNIALHIGGQYLDDIRGSMVPGDEPYLRMARGEAKEGGVKSWLNAHFASTPANEHVRRKVSDTAYDAAALLGPKSDKGLAKYVEESFDLDRLRADAVDAGALANDNADLEMKVFSANPAQNYLTNFVEVADAHKIKLVFYRVKRCPNAQNVTAQDEYLQTYTAALKAWVEGKGHHHVDETDDPRITHAMFRDGDHLHQEYYDTYTDLFAERMRPFLPEPFTYMEIEAAGREEEQPNSKERTNP